MSEKLIITECPRDAMQGLHEFIPTQTKSNYINTLLKVGFDVLDFGSFVSPKAIPQMRDTAEVLNQLDMSNTSTELLAIVANQRGAEDACVYEQINYLGYPFSISETFQLKNTNATIEKSLANVDAMQNLCAKHEKKLLIYISMAFGNPYGDDWSSEIAIHWTRHLADLGIKYIMLADTIGIADTNNIRIMFSNLLPQFPHVSIGAHLHTKPDEWKEKVEAAYQNGCRRFDSAIMGFGGCPMAKDDLTGNLATENLLSFCKEKNIETHWDLQSWNEALLEAQRVFR